MCVAVEITDGPKYPYTIDGLGSFTRYEDIHTFLPTYPRAMDIGDIWDYVCSMAAVCRPNVVL